MDVIVIGKLISMKYQHLITCSGNREKPIGSNGCSCKYVALHHKEILKMNNKDILHQILKGMCPYLSCGVPIQFWNLSKILTKEIYGESGVKLLKKFHETSEDRVAVDITLHTIHGWENEGNTEIGPKELIKKLESL